MAYLDSQAEKHSGQVVVGEGDAGSVFAFPFFAGVFFPDQPGGVFRDPLVAFEIVEEGFEVGHFFSGGGDFHGPGGAEFAQVEGAPLIDVDIAAVEAEVDKGFEHVAVGADGVDGVGVGDVGQVGVDGFFDGDALFAGVALGRLQWPGGGGDLGIGVPAFPLSDEGAGLFSIGKAG